MAIRNFIWLLLQSTTSSSLSFGKAAGTPVYTLPRAAVIPLPLPASTQYTSIEHSPSFSSFSIEPVFWVEFFGNDSSSNLLTVDLLKGLTARGAQPIIRPGGITMDSMIFDPAGGNPVRTMSAKGGIYRTTVGPAYFKSWNNLPTDTGFVATLDFRNNSLQIATDMALAAAKYQPRRIKFFELGNEPTYYPGDRWNGNTQAYVSQWKEWTASIDSAINSSGYSFPGRRWWASSAVTGSGGLKVRPVDIIPAGVDSQRQVGQYSIHSYAFDTCSESQAAKATISNLLNHTSIATFADQEIVPSGRASIASGSQWTIGEYNSIACSGKIGVSDTFAQALWVLDSQVAYAVRNASSVFLHQGATLVFQSGSQVNTPGFSSYNFVYPRDSQKHGQARALPSYSALLVLAELFAESGTAIRSIPAPSGMRQEGFIAYAFYVKGKLSKLLIMNSTPYFSNSSEDFTIDMDVSAYMGGLASVPVKRLTAPFVDETSSGSVTWAGQSFENGKATGDLKIETTLANRRVRVRGSEAVLLYLDSSKVYIA